MDSAITFSMRMGWWPGPSCLHHLGDFIRRSQRFCVALYHDDKTPEQGRAHQVDVFHLQVQDCFCETRPWAEVVLLGQHGYSVSMYPVGVHSERSASSGKYVHHREAIFVGTQTTLANHKKPGKHYCHMRMSPSHKSPDSRLQDRLNSWTALR